MQRCLHDPQRGYYAKQIRSIGSRGDFTTAPQLSEAPAKAIARWASRAMRQYRTRHLIEIGPGLGTLAKQILKHLPRTQRWITKLHLVDSSATLLSHQKKQLGRLASYHSSIHEALTCCDGNAIIYSNELVDAFPVRLFRKTLDRWMEVAVEHADKTTREILVQPENLPVSSIFSIQFPTDQRVEIHESYHTWLKSWLPMWKQGEMLTIDYGNTSDQMYLRRPNGSLRAYLLQQRIEGTGIYQNPGLQDITADVNFTDLVEWSEPWLHPHQLANLTEFLQPFLATEDQDFIRASGHFMFLLQSPHDRYK
ncbi:MAG: hypothetical protein RL346_828 [Verrucomicrobiota bacterium]